MSNQASFATALLSKDPVFPRELSTGNGPDPASRFGIYRNNVIVSLTEALADTFPVVQQLVGEAFFRAMARMYALDSPPRSPVMSDYGGDFPAFIAAFSPASGVPYLADIARLEWLRVQACHAQDQTPLDADTLAQLLADSERLPLLRARFHPSAALLKSRHAIVSIWSRHQQNAGLRGLDLGQAEQALVLRPALDVLVVPLDPGTWSFTRALQEGETLGSALESAQDTELSFDPVSSLSELIRLGLFTSLYLNAEQSS